MLTTSSVSSPNCQVVSLQLGMVRQAAPYLSLSGGVPSLYYYQLITLLFRPLGRVTFLFRQKKSNQK
ncbi:MAG: hypothetical protein ABW160_08495, partial [Candidatus Thiodiazotropha sp. 4PDIV1]